MGTLCIGGDANTAPDWSCNATGSEPWSGLKESDFDDSKKQILLEFCIDEGRRQGWNDSFNSRTSDDCGNIFHPKFLSGLPFETWNKSYIGGVKEHLQSPYRK